MGIACIFESSELSQVPGIEQVFRKCTFGAWVNSCKLSLTQEAPETNKTLLSGDLALLLFQNRGSFTVLCLEASRKDSSGQRYSTIQGMGIITLTHKVVVKMK